MNIRWQHGTATSLRHSACCRSLGVSCWTVHMWIWDYCKANNLTQNESAVVRSVCLSLIAMCRSHTPHVQTTLAASTLLSSLSGPRNKFSHWLTHNKVANHNTFFELVTKKCSWEITMDLCYQCLQVWKKQKQFDALKREREREGWGKGEIGGKNHLPIWATSPWKWVAQQPVYLPQAVVNVKPWMVISFSSFTFKGVDENVSFIRVIFGIKETYLSYHAFV